MFKLNIVAWNSQSLNESKEQEVFHHMNENANSIVGIIETQRQHDPKLVHLKSFDRDMYSLSSRGHSEEQQLLSVNPWLVLLESGLNFVWMKIHFKP